MNRYSILSTLLLSILLSLLLSTLTNAEQVNSPESAQRMLTAANLFLDSLAPEQRQQAMFDFGDEERYNWNYVPTTRKGLPLKGMNDEQKQRAHDFLQTGLSDIGYSKVAAIILLESILNDTERFSWISRDPEKYYLTFFGSLSQNGTWGWRFEGHHISINVTIVDGQSFATTPTFLGANPAEVREGVHSGMRPLAAEEDIARQLMKSLNPAQLQKAQFRERAFREIVTRSDRQAALQKSEGIAFTELNEMQQALLMQLVEEYAATMPEEIAQLRLQKIRNNKPESLFFGWAGERAKGEAHYYRIQGPEFIIEYANTQNDANHVHTVWREYDGDFGRDLLKEHLHHHHQE